MRFLALGAASAIATVLSFGVEAADSPILLQRSDRPSMAWFGPRRLRLPKCSSSRVHQLGFPGIMVHQFGPRWSGIRPMPRCRRWLPRVSRPEPLCRHKGHAARYGAAGIAVAAGARTAHRTPNITPAPMGHPARSSTQTPRDLRNPTQARISRPVRRSTLGRFAACQFTKRPSRAGMARTSLPASIQPTVAPSRRQ
jgi:hypothetical protein